MAYSNVLFLLHMSPENIQWVDEDVENVDNVVDEPHEEPQDPITEDVGGDS